MSRKKGQVFSTEQKTKIVLELLKEDRTIAQLVTKYQIIYIDNFSTIKELKNGIDEYIHKYNFKRFHSSIGYQKPMNVYLEYLKMWRNETGTWWK